MKSLFFIILSGVSWSLLTAQILPFGLDISLTQGGIASQLDKSMLNSAKDAGLTDDYQYRTLNMWEFHDLSLQIGVLPFAKHPSWRVGLMHQRADKWDRRYSLWESASSFDWEIRRDRRIWGIWVDRRLFPVSHQLYRRWEGAVGLGAHAMRSATEQEIMGFSQLAGFRFVEIRQERISALWYGFSLRSSLEYYLAPFLSLQARMDGFWFPEFQEAAPQPDPPIDWIDGPLKPYSVQLASINIMFGLHFHFR